MAEKGLRASDFGLWTSDLTLRTADFGSGLLKRIFSKGLFMLVHFLLIIAICSHKRGCTIDKEIKKLDSKRTITATFEKNLKQKHGIFYIQGKKVNHASFTRRFKCHVI